jgi:hypothetical protein
MKGRSSGLKSLQTHRAMRSGRIVTRLSQSFGLEGFAAFIQFYESTAIEPSIVFDHSRETRMRDFYDIYILTTTQPFDGGTFTAALDKTIEKRGTAEQMADTADVSWDMAIHAVNVLAGLMDGKDEMQEA